MIKVCMKSLVGIAAFLLPLTAFATNDSQRPNILLIMAEDLSPRIGAFDDTVAVTPNLDALAQEGTRYTSVFTTAGVCAPSRAGQILGMHQISWGGQHMRAGRIEPYKAVPPAGVKAYPELLRASGYFAYNTEKLDYQFSNPLPSGIPLLGGGPFTVWDNDTAEITGWRERADGQPFFGMINLNVTHESGVFPPLGQMPNSVMGLVTQIIRWSSYGRINEPVKPESIIVPPYYPDTPTVREDIARHYNNIWAMDSTVGELLDELESDGLNENTIVIWTTDHGDGLPRGKREIYDSGILVPMIIRWPERYRPKGADPGDFDHRLVSFVDFAKTILALAGADQPRYLHGKDLRTSDRQYVFASRDRIDEVSDRQRAVRDKDFKYIRSWHPEQPGGHKLAYRDNLKMMREMQALYANGRLNAEQSLWFRPVAEERLYDLRNDPFELNDVAQLTTYSAELARMRNALNEWLNKVGDMSDISEALMAEQFWPGGKQPVTSAPFFREADGKIEILCKSKAASIGYRYTDSQWQLYTAPLPDDGRRVEAKAVRYGWKESDITAFSES
jgi:N-sulfoglucosamine sulfohydrolase